MLRVAGAGLTATMAAIHLRLWAEGYRGLSVIGPLFLINGIVGILLALALLATPARRLGLVAAGTSLFTAGTLGALVLSLTTGLFGFTESPDANLVRPTLYVETAGTVVTAVLAVTALGLHRYVHLGGRHVRGHRHPAGAAAGTDGGAGAASDGGAAAGAGSGSSGPG
ncbi:hypothetical protein WN71_023660 [Streptomyces mangrovisoli]|uniref:Uncharacterized protein n=1 Tax=Streptomyces mangrovisoli TaxID=1428628 RepID=A0A1J4NSA7_9ACTN|nr:hypothetical protein WN71_023660 [Streptomyces mangrovisoli]